MKKVMLTVLLVGALACTSVQTVRDPVAFMATNPEQVLVTYEDRSEVPIASPRIRNDSIIGTWEGIGEPVALPLDKIDHIDAIQKDTKKTVLFIGSLVAVTAVTAYGLSLASQDHGQVCDYNRPEDRQCYST